MLMSQWDNGLISDNIFHTEIGLYFSGLEFWRTQDQSHTAHSSTSTGIILPPVNGFILVGMYKSASVKNAARGRHLFDAANLLLLCKI